MDCREVCDRVYYYQKKLRSADRLVEELEKTACKTDVDCRFLQDWKTRAKRDLELARLLWTQSVRECSACTRMKLAGLKASTTTL